MKKIRIFESLGLLAAGLIIVGCGPTKQPTPVEPTPTPVEPACTHSYSFVSDGPETHHEECSKCHDKKPSVPHNWDEGVVGSGVILYTCKDCSETKTEKFVVPAKAGVYNFDSFSAGDITERTKVAEGIFLNASSSNKLTVDANSKKYTPESTSTEVSSTNRLKFNGTTKAAGDRTIEVVMEKAGVINVYSLTSSSSSLDRQIAFWDDSELTAEKGDALLVSGNYSSGSTVEKKAFHSVKKGTYFVGCTGNASNVYAVEIIYDTCAHEFTTTVESSATCEVRGSTKYSCKHCNLVVSLNDIARSEHKWSSKLVFEDGFHWIECSVCHSVKADSKVACTADPAKHEAGATPTKDNPVTYDYDTCSICGGRWASKKNEWKDDAASEVVVADANTYKFVDAKALEFVISENCKYVFNPENTLKSENDKAGVKAFKMDKGDEFNFVNGAEFTNKYFHLTGMKAGQKVLVTCNSGGGSRGIKFSASEEVLVAKNEDASALQVVTHTVTAAEETNGVKFSAYGGTIHVSKIVWVK